jgi:uncharacterized protein (DUF2237 family)
MRQPLLPVALLLTCCLAPGPSPARAQPHAVEVERMPDRNLDGEPLAVCGTDPVTGYWRNGQCSTGPQDTGSHTVCARVTAEFLAFTGSRGNDLATPRGGFPGLRPGDAWCLCASRWEEARRADVAPPVVLAATHEAALRVVERAHLEAHRAP